MSQWGLVTRHKLLHDGLVGTNFLQQSDLLPACLYIKTSCLGGAPLDEGDRGKSMRLLIAFSDKDKVLELVNAETDMTGPVVPLYNTCRLGHYGDCALSCDCNVELM